MSKSYQPPHGMSGTPEYSAWCRFRRGKLCEEWTNNFLAFYFYVGQRPTKKHRLERIDIGGPWGPGNLEWTTPEQSAARREVQRRAFSAYQERTRKPPVVYQLSCPKCGIKFFSLHKHKRYCSRKCKSANSHFVRQFNHTHQG